VRSPMPGSVIAVRVAAQDPVAKGDVLLVVEAMKMEHALAAPLDGVVSELAVRVGDQVVVDQLLATVTPPDQA
jgi:acetyl-CoA/propionyl-CoA carboxylase biotin carboxyl carrier protein